jgi:hypothetical protein
MRPTDAAIATLLWRASWQVEGVGHQLSAAERTAIAQRMREFSDLLLPARSNDMAAAEYYRPGVYNGD